MVHGLHSNLSKNWQFSFSFSNFVFVKIKQIPIPMSVLLESQQVTTQVTTLEVHRSPEGGKGAAVAKVTGVVDARLLQMFLTQPRPESIVRKILQPPMLIYITT